MSATNSAAFTPPYSPAPFFGGGPWTAQQENYGGVKVGSLGQVAQGPVGGGWPAQQDTYGGVSIAGTVVNPTSF